MRLFGWGSGYAKREDLLALQAALKQLETRLEAPVEVEVPDLRPLESRIEKLELEHGERHVHVLNTLEKITRQLAARERARRRDEDDEPEDAAGDGVTQPAPAPAGSPALPPSAHLARRFKVGG